MGNDGKKEALLHYAVASIGGFLGGYAIINHCDLFGNAQTANLIHLVTNIFSGEFDGIFFLLLSFATYVAGNVAFVVADKLFQRLDLRIFSLLLTSLAVVLIGVFPNISNDYVAILPIIFTMPIQWNVFRGAKGYNSSTIFSTNNLRQATVSLTKYIIEKDEQQKDKAKFFWLTLASFHIGVAFSCVVSLFFGVNSIWFGFVPIAFSATAYLILEWKNLSIFSHAKVNDSKIKAK